MRLEIDIAEHHYNNIMALDSVSLGRVPYKGIIMYSINAIKHGRVLDQEPITKNDLGVDCISRAEAIKCLECDFDITGKENMKTVVNYINSAHNKIVNLPSVKQEPKKGQWDKDGACPFCGYFQQWDDDNFCGHCGAKLNEVNQDFNQDFNQE